MRGFAYEPKKGDCSLYLNHVRDNICRGNEDHYKLVVAWMADAVRIMAGTGTGPSPLAVVKVPVRRLLRSLLRFVRRPRYRALRREERGL